MSGLSWRYDLPDATKALAAELRAEAHRLMPSRPGRAIVLGPGESVIPFKPQGSSCSHRQAEPVVLFTGETVACVCILCMEQLPSDWIDMQRWRAETEARCSHEDLAEITRFDSPHREYTCLTCGGWNPGWKVS